MPIPLDSRKKPSDVKVHVKTGAGVDITWTDGHVSHYEFAYLREECPCATCNDERGKKQAFAATAAPESSAFPALPMFKPKPQRSSATTPYKSASRMAIPLASIVTHISAAFAPAPSAPRRSARLAPKSF